MARIWSLSVRRRHPKKTLSLYRTGRYLLRCWRAHACHEGCCRRAIRGCARAAPACARMIPLPRPSPSGFSTAGLKAFQQAMRALVDEAQAGGRDDARGPPRQGGPLRRLRQADLEAKKPVDEGHDLPHRVDDQADRRRGDDDAVGTGQVDARRSGGEAHSRVRRPEGRDAEWRSAADQADDHATAHEPYRGLRRQRRLCQAQHHRSDRSRCRR